MSDELQKQLVELIKSLTGVVKDGANWVSGQIPPLVHEKIVLGRIEETVTFAVCFLVAAVALWWSIRYWNAIWKFSKEESAPFIFANILGIGLGGVLIFVPLHDFILVWFAPRLYIVEWLLNLKK